MIVMRLVPAAREAFLRLIDAPGLAQLGSVGEVDMQTQDFVGHGDAGDEIKELISVFLAPDESREDAGDTVESAPRGQRLDGVLWYGQELVIVIESKVVEGADDWQRRTLDYGHATVAEARRRLIFWHD